MSELFLLTRSESFKQGLLLNIDILKSKSDIITSYEKISDNDDLDTIECNCDNDVCDCYDEDKIYGHLSFDQLLTMLKDAINKYTYEKWFKLINIPICHEFCVYYAFVDLCGTDTVIKQLGCFDTYDSALKFSMQQYKLHTKSDPHIHTGKYNGSFTPITHVKYIDTQDVDYLIKSPKDMDSGMECLLIINNNYNKFKAFPLELHNIWYLDN